MPRLLELRVIFAMLPRGDYGRTAIYLLCGFFFPTAALANYLGFLRILDDMLIHMIYPF